MKQLHLLDALFARVRHVPGEVVRRRFRGARYAADDLEQIALVAVWLALPRLSSAKGRPEQLAATVAFRACCSELRRGRQQERLREALTLEAAA